MYFNFNRIYIIESLRPQDRKTGKELYEDLLRYQEIKYPILKVIYRCISSKKEWDSLMDEIAVDCEQKGNQPILHLEIHGAESGDGLVLENGEYLAFDSIRPQIVRINVSSQCNLFLTLAVCKGLLLLRKIKLTEPMPFCGLLGAYDTIMEDDIAIRFNEFYEEFFCSFELAKAYQRLLSVNPGIPHSYGFIHADELFCKVYHRYIERECNDDKVIKERALKSTKENGIILTDRQSRRKCQRAFMAEEKRTRLKYYQSFARSFFLLDQFPDNKERFNVPMDLRELKLRQTLLSK